MRTSRRTFLKSAGGFLLVGYSRGGAALATVLQADGLYRDPDFKQLDSWIVIHEDNTATQPRRARHRPGRRTPVSTTKRR